MYAANYDGLKKRETYNEIVEYLQYGQEKIKYPDRRAKQLRESPQLSNLLDGNGSSYLEGETQQQNAMTNQQVEHMLRDKAKKEKFSAQLLRGRVNKLHRQPEQYDLATSEYESAFDDEKDKVERHLAEQAVAREASRSAAAKLAREALADEAETETRGISIGDVALGSFDALVAAASVASSSASLAWRVGTATLGTVRWATTGTHSRYEAIEYDPTARSSRERSPPVRARMSDEEYNGRFASGQSPDQVLDAMIRRGAFP